MKEIRAGAKNLRSLLRGAKFAIDYYQREYQWETKQVTELIEDLAGKFLESYKPCHERLKVKTYGHYFLGSIIISDKQNQKYIIDGQQRLTTLTLLLTHIYRLLEDNEQKGIVAELIFSTQFGYRSFNMDVEERAECMEALFTGKPFYEEGQSESVINIIRRFQDLEDLFPNELIDHALPYFSDWLIENVYLIEITTYSDTDAYTIFETMNDRGLSLAPTDMLKGYILANIQDSHRRNEANQRWRKLISDLKDIGKEEDSDAIKAWLRSQYAETIRERHQGARPRDFDLIGTEFHRWVRDHRDTLGLSSQSGFVRFIEEDFNFYGSWYSQLLKAKQEITPGLEAVYYCCAQSNFTLQYPVLLASLRRTDQERDLLRKLRIVSAYLDILIAQRIWNWRSINYSTLQYNMFSTMRAIRGKDVPSLVNTLTDQLAQEMDKFTTNERFCLNRNNGPRIHLLLARLTDYVETSSRRHSLYQEYVRRGGNNGYEIEHIWADHFERHYDDFEHATDFAEYRNRIGCLLLLPKSFNASYGNLPYEEKRNHYLKQNLLASSLHENAYEHDPGFKQFIRTSGLRFGPHRQFRKDDLEKRQRLYTKLAERVWNPERLAHEAES